jgi:hypothetical protein
MLEIVDADCRRLAEADGTEMPRDLYAARVRRLDQRGELFGGDVHVRLERRHAFVHPILGLASSVLRVTELPHLRRVRAFALEIGTGDAHLRPDHQPIVDRAFELEIGVRFDAPSRAHRGDAACEVQAREARGVLAVHGGRTTRRRVVHVLVHADDAGNDAVARKVENGRAVRYRDGRVAAQCRDLSAGNDERLALAWG